MSKNNRQTLSSSPLPNPLVIQLERAHENLSVFDESGDKPTSLRRKAQFFMDQKLYGRACQILELLQDLGGRDGPLLSTLASLQILDGSLEKAQLTLGNLAQEAACGPQIFLCHAEIERHRKGTQEAIAYLENGGFKDNPNVLARINALQVADNA